MTAELPLVVSAVAISIVTLLLSLTAIRSAWRVRIALATTAVGMVAPPLLYAAREPAPATGRALWEWSAVGGPTIQAAYSYDGVAAVGLTLTVGFAAAGLAGIARMSRRRPMLPGLVLAIGLVSIALFVTTDLVAAIVVLGVVAALTAFVALVVAPAPASARLATFLAIGIQAFVVAALLVSRFGGASFRFDEIRPTWVSPGVVLAAALGGALFAGLYPFVPWRFDRVVARASAEGAPLRGLLAMPAGIGGSILLLRLLGTARLDITTLGLPALDPAVRAVLIVGVSALLAARAARRRLHAPTLALGTATVLVAALYPLLHWSHLVLAAALMTVLYAAAVSLATPDEWSVVRYDVALAGLWIAMGLGTPIALAGGLALLVAEATGAIAEVLWMPPHRSRCPAVPGRLRRHTRQRSDRRSRCAPPRRSNSGWTTSMRFCAFSSWAAQASGVYANWSRY